MNNPIIVLTGPTASGKSAISLEVAQKFDCEIICADSMTVYRGMDVGTDKPGAFGTPSEKLKAKNKKFYSSSKVEKFSSRKAPSNDNWRDVNGIPHHLLDIRNPDEEFNVSIFIEEVTKLVNEIQHRGKIPMLVGGSVLYIDAFVFNYKLPPIAPNNELREELEKLETDELFEKLCKLDPDCEWTVDRHNRRRIIRALEVWLATERPFSEQKSKTPLPDNILYLAVDRDREKLYESIDARVDVMFRTGFIEEVKQLKEKYDNNTAMQAAGYKQIGEFLDGKTTMEDAATRTKQTHRNYAKRQLTWLRRNEDIQWIKDASEAGKLISKFLL